MDTISKAGDNCRVLVLVEHKTWVGTGRVHSMRSDSAGTMITYPVYHAMHSGDQVIRYNTAVHDPPPSRHFFASVHVQRGPNASRSSGTRHDL